MINSEAEYNQMLSDNAEYEYYNWQREMNTIKIGSQEWATEDLKVTKFRNGEAIPLVTDNEEWAKLDTAAYCITSRGDYLYNWYAVNDPRGLAPEGFHVPSDEEWTELTNHLGGASVAGKKMKTSAWNGTNSSGFSALPGGGRGNFYGHFLNGGGNGYWWSSSANGADYAWYRNLDSRDVNVYRNFNYLRYGFSVRCLKNKREMKREMKTPVKELYEKLWEADKDRFAWNAILMEMLEKEKEVMYRCYKAHRPITMIDGNGKEVVDGNHMKYKFDNYYNETFNTNEK